MKTKWDTILVDVKDGVATVTLNRPEKRNAMSPRLHEDMTEVLEMLRYEDSARVVVLTGAGKAFCGGMDLKEFFVALKDKPHEMDRITRLAVEWRGRTLRLYPKPTIAMVNGYCFGGGFSVVEGCDLAVAAEEATFGLSEINFKMFPGGSVSKSMANLFRPRDALFYGLTGRPFNGIEAARIGFVNYAVPLAQLESNVTELARELANKDPVALRATKDGYKHSLDMGFDASINFTTAKQAELQLAQDDSWRSEGIGGFLNKEYRPGLGSNPNKKS